MWIVTARGFYSAVAKREDGDEFVTVRARSERDIRNLADLIDAEPTSGEGTDYRWRIRCHKAEFAQAVATMAQEIDYSNFKNRIASENPERARLLAQVWNVLYEIQTTGGEAHVTIAFDDDRVAKSLAQAVAKWKSRAADGEINEAAFDAPPGKRRSTGIVLVDEAGHVTIREPANHYGGYNWSYAKGRIEPGETPQQAAHRELKEETGLTGRILALIGDFEGDMGITRFYVGVRTGGNETKGPETWTVKTVSPLTAMGMLNRQRDRDVLSRLIELARDHGQSSPVVLSDRFDQALQFAAATHRTQKRKGTEIPYIGHLLGVCSLVLEDGGSEDEAIGALLHDAAEDQGGRAMLDQIQARFGPEVTEIVEGCTDTTEDPKPPWRQRKQAYLEHLSSQPESVLRVSVADKLFNARAILRDYKVHGEQLWDRFRAGREGQLWYYRELADRFTELLPERRMAKELSEVVAELEQAVMITD